MGTPPIIFLDHDGVICLYQNWGSRFKKAKDWADKMGYPLVNLYERPDLPVEANFDNFDKKAVRVLNKILTETGAEIVVSSDWRIGTSLQDMQELYLGRGIIKAPIGMTPVFRETGGEADRVKEIRDWLDKNPHDKWVAVDDMNLGALGRFVHTPRSSEGIKQSGVAEKIIKWLKD